jgi:2-(1,2-epoxy-1,2-dihydrophenyl)acetyl-CoA isomerase
MGERMSDTAPLLVERRPGYRVLTLNRPHRLNAFDAGLHAALRAALAEAAGDEDCRAVLLAGSGRAFCAGQDLAEPGLLEHDVDLGAVLDRGWNALVAQLRALPKPVVCAVQGTAAGAGASIALACDITLAAEDARFAQAFIRIGLIPDSGGTWFLPRLVGPARARALAMLGDPISGTEAAGMGLIFRAVPAEALLAEAHALAAKLARLPAQALAATKRVLDAAEGNTLAEQLLLEAAEQRSLGRSADYAEGVAAFQQKRAPHFEGAPE